MLRVFEPGELDAAIAFVHAAPPITTALLEVENAQGQWEHRGVLPMGTAERVLKELASDKRFRISWSERRL
jgi:hypothetical protein